RPIGTEEAEDFTAVDRKADMVDSRERSEPLCQPLYLERMAHRLSLLPFDQPVRKSTFRARSSTGTSNATNSICKGSIIPDPASSQSEPGPLPRTGYDLEGCDLLVKF